MCWSFGDIFDHGCSHALSVLRPGRDLYIASILCRLYCANCLGCADCIVASIIHVVQSKVERKDRTITQL